MRIIIARAAIYRDPLNPDDRARRRKAYSCDRCSVPRIFVLYRGHSIYFSDLMVQTNEFELRGLWLG